MGRQRTLRGRWIAAGAAIFGLSALLASPALAQVTFQIEALWGMRSAVTPVPLMSSTFNPGTGDSFHSEDLIFDWGPGFRGTAQFADNRLEFGGLFQSWQTERWDRCVGPCVVLVETSGYTTGLSTGAHGRTMTNATSLFGVFTNAIARPASAVALTIGAAYYSLNDILTLVVDAEPEGTGDGRTYETFMWDVTNRMTGPQIGARLGLGEDRERGLFATLEGNTALLFNSILRHATWDEELAGPQADSTTTDGTFGWMLEGGASIGINVSERLQLSVGYRAMWFGNVALAPDQVGATREDLDGFFAPALTNFMSQSVTAGFTLGL